MSALTGRFVRMETRSWANVGVTEKHRPLGFFGLVRVGAASQRSLKILQWYLVHAGREIARDLATDYFQEIDAAFADVPRGGIIFCTDNDGFISCIKMIGGEKAAVGTIPISDENVLARDVGTMIAFDDGGRDAAGGFLSGT